MITLKTRLVLTLLVAGMLLAGCSQQQTKPVSHQGVSQSMPEHQRKTPRAVTPAPAARHSTVSTAASTSDSTATSDAGQPEQTGVPACDDYLSSYIACHRAAHIFAPGQLPQRYQAMRESLLQDSKNPDIRPQLAVRCNSLATQLREALHGKSCAVETPASSSSP